MEFSLFFIQIVVAIAVALPIGWQREVAGKSAGLRTFILVSVGSTIFTQLSRHAFDDADTARIAAQIVAGIGFLGAGTIIQQKDKVQGLTTAAGLWAMAAVGMMIGADWLEEAIATSLLLFFILYLKDTYFSRPKSSNNSHPKTPLS